MVLPYFFSDCRSDKKNLPHSCLKWPLKLRATIILVGTSEQSEEQTAIAAILAADAEFEKMKSAQASNDFDWDVSVMEPVTQESISARSPISLL